MVGRFCDVVVRYRVVVGFHGVHQDTLVGPLRVLILLALFSCVCVDVVVVVHGLT